MQKKKKIILKQTVINISKELKDRQFPCAKLIHQQTIPVGKKWKAKTKLVPEYTL